MSIEKLASLYYSMAMKLPEGETTPEEDNVLDIDLKKGLLKIKGNPKEVLINDPLLILRIIQIAAENELDLDLDIIEAAKDIDVQREILKNRDGLWAKLTAKVFISKNPGEAAELFGTLGLRDLLFTISQEDMEGMGLEKAPLVSWEINPHNSHHDLSLWQHCLATLKNIDKNTKNKIKKNPRKYAIRNLAAIFHDMGKRYTGIQELQPNDPETKKFEGHEDVSARFANKILKDLGAPESVVHDVCHLIYHHMDEHRIIKKKKNKKTLIRKLVNDIRDEDEKKSIMKNLVDLAKADAKGRVGRKENKIDKKYNKLKKKLKKRVKE